MSKMDKKRCGDYPPIYEKTCRHCHDCHDIAIERDQVEALIHANSTANMVEVDRIIRGIAEVVSDK